MNAPVSIPSPTQRRILAGSMACEECRGRGEVGMGERHGFFEFALCHVCNGKRVIPIWKEIIRD